LFFKQFSIQEGEMDTFLRLLTVDLEPTYLPSQVENESGSKISRCTLHKTLCSSLDVWEYSPGDFEWQVDEDQSTWVLAGSAEVELSDGRSISLRPGSTLYLMRGLSSRWTVAQTLRTVTARGS
jgi:uncharacterized cupin superfamily protein